MKTIKITEKHKSKLLEMCKVLFPKYNHWKFGSMKISADYELWFYDENNKNYEIHWFEFCMTHLADKIFKYFFVNRDGHYMRLYNSINNCIEESEYNHPIDYLYAQFKKLKWI